MWSSYDQDDMRSLIQILFVFALAGCSWSASKTPSILIIAVEGLSSEAFYCGGTDTEFSEGLGVLCTDGVRFTHAFAPSTLSQSTLASMFTGLYPQDTGVLHNGSHYLSEKFVTVPEVAFSLGYRTSFFSGGPPIWRKSGIDQGFELFEDNLSISREELYRPVDKNFELFLKWQKDTANGKPFFSVIFLPDLQFVMKSTIDNRGQERAQGFDGQLREINESFAELVVNLKKEQLWDNTYIILTGLNGKTMPSRFAEINTTNLHSDGAQILLIIKPAQKARDAGLDWAIDANVSLTDVGATLFDILGSPENITSKDSQLDVSSLRKSLIKPQVNWKRDRYIVNQSAWAEWREVGGVRYAVRHNNMLYINDESPLLYNSLTDRYETQPMQQNDGLIRQSAEVIRKYLESRNMERWTGISPQVIERIKIQSDMMNAAIPRENIKLRLSHLIKKRAWDKQLVGWLARFALDDNDWPLLEKLGIENLNPTWVYVAKRNQGIDLLPPSDFCWKWLDKRTSLSRNTSACSDQEFMAFAEWTKETNPQKKSQFEEKFFRISNYLEIDYEIATINFQNALPWDTDISIPAEPRLTELASTLPEYKGFRQVMDSRLRR
ncbi:MAG: sulfatase-like hydrolase/transferase [Bdellovibrionales bacterium]|nr:sulfatase-like hydrolase/transferase [Bdellovibrionales bacterium]